jgi:hypothetical protein
MTANFWKSKCWTTCGIALLSFAAGSLMTARMAHLNQVRADSNRVFELRVYHATPGKLPALESRFRNTTSKLLARHDLKVMGYWVPEGSPNLGQYIRRYPGVSQPGGSDQELESVCSRPGISRGDQIRAGQQAGGERGLDVHASD